MIWYWKNSKKCTVCEILRFSVVLVKIKIKSKIKVTEAKLFQRHLQMYTKIIKFVGRYNKTNVEANKNEPISLLKKTKNPGHSMRFLSIEDIQCQQNWYYPISEIIKTFLVAYEQQTVQEIL